MFKCLKKAQDSLYTSGTLPCMIETSSICLFEEGGLRLDRGRWCVVKRSYNMSMYRAQVFFAADATFTVLTAI